MSTWDRFKRVVQANLGRLREDPLGRPLPGQSGRDYQDLSESLETVRKQLTHLEQDLARLDAEERELSGRIEAALAAERRDEGLRHAATLGRVREDKARVERQLAAARRVVERAEGLQRSVQRADEELLKAQAEETLDRLEQGLAAEPAHSGGKTIGTDSGPAPVADTGPQRSMAKTIGGAAGDSGPQPVSGPERDVEKTIGPAPAARGARGSGDLLDELERLGRLKEQGLLSEDEFAAAKKKLLSD